jgi:hypothetical protein
MEFKIIANGIVSVLSMDQKEERIGGRECLLLSGKAGPNQAKCLNDLLGNAQHGQKL